MLDGKRIAVVLPAYQAEKTLERTVRALPPAVVDHLLLVDDASTDQTVRVAQALGVATTVHASNRGYGANQKTCYALALATDADVVVMLHPDYQYEPRLLTALAGMVASGIYDVALGSRILGGTARAGAMPLYKYVANRALTAFENLLLGSKLSEFHTGYRAFARAVIERLPLRANSDDFLFDNQILVQALAFGFRIGEISCPAHYFAGASSIGPLRATIYGLGVVHTALAYRLWRWGLLHPDFLNDAPDRRLRAGASTQAPVSISDR